MARKGSRLKSLQAAGKADWRNPRGGLPRAERGGSISLHLRQNNGKRKVLVHQEKSWCIKGFFFCPNNWQILTRRNCQGVNAFMGEKQIPRLLICNVWGPCVLSLFLMVWHLPITKNKQGNNENTLDIPRKICYNMLNGRFPIRKKGTGLIGSHIAQ